MRTQRFNKGDCWSQYYCRAHSQQPVMLNAIPLAIFKQSWKWTPSKYMTQGQSSHFPILLLHWIIWDRNEHEYHSQKIQWLVQNFTHCWMSDERSNTAAANCSEHCNILSAFELSFGGGGLWCFEQPFARYTTNAQAGFSISMSGNSDFSLHP